MPSGARCFSTMDLASGYNQVPVEEKDKLLVVQLLDLTNLIVCLLAYVMPRAHFNDSWNVCLDCDIFTPCCCI